MYTGDQTSRYGVLRVTIDAHDEKQIKRLCARVCLIVARHRVTNKRQDPKDKNKTYQLLD